MANKEKAKARRVDDTKRENFHATFGSTTKRPSGAWLAVSRRKRVAYMKFTAHLSPMRKKEMQMPRKRRSSKSFASATRLEAVSRGPTAACS